MYLCTFIDYFTKYNSPTRTYHHCVIARVVALLQFKCSSFVLTVLIFAFARIQVAFILLPDSQRERMYLFCGALYTKGLKYYLPAPHIYLFQPPPPPGSSQSAKLSLVDFNIQHPVRRIRNECDDFILRLICFTAVMEIRAWYANKLIWKRYGQMREACNICFTT